MRRLLIISTSLLLAAGAAGCSKDEDNPTLQSPSSSAPAATSAAPTSGAPAAGGVVTVNQVDNDFDPAALTAKAGAAMNVKVTNSGERSHTFTIDGVSGADVTLAAGKSETISFTLPATGPVRFYCRFHGGGGMEGTITLTG